jgi:hypothetical protein
MVTTFATAETSGWRRSVLALACAAAVVLGATACVGSDSSSGTAPGAPTRERNGGQPIGDPKEEHGGQPNGTPTEGDGGPQAKGAPIRIPAFNQGEGSSLAGAVSFFTAEVRELCGGEMCITLTVEESAQDYPTCVFAGTDPEPGSQVERGSTLTIVAGSQPCVFVIEDFSSHQGERVGLENLGWVG